MFLKVKREEIVKYQTCLDGQKQYKNPVLVNANTPKVSTEFVLIMVIVNTHEGRDVGIFDIPGAFLSADMEKDVKMALHERQKGVMGNIFPQIYRYIVIHE